MGDTQFVMMPNGAVHRFNAQTQVLSGLVAVGEAGHAVTPGNWPEWVDRCACGEEGKHLKDLGYEHLGNNVLSFSAFLVGRRPTEAGLALVGRDDYVRSLGETFGLLDCEVQHALDSDGDSYGAEAVVRIQGGRELRCPSFPDECDYVRICFGGVEIGYWVADEWRQHGDDVMGAIVGAMRGSRGG